MRNYHVDKEKWKYIFNPNSTRKKNFTLEELFDRTKTRIAQPINFQAMQNLNLTKK